MHWFVYKSENFLHCSRLLECHKLFHCPHFSKFIVTHRSQCSELSINRSLALKLVSLMDDINCRRNIARLTLRTKKKCGRRVVYLTDLKRDMSHATWHKKMADIKFILTICSSVVTISITCFNVGRKTEFYPNNAFKHFISTSQSKTIKFVNRLHFLIGVKWLFSEVRTENLDIT
jgi:hypothetical protein